MAMSGNKTTKNWNLWARWIGGFFLVSAATVTAGEVDGYQTAKFGMSPEEVVSTFKDDGVTETQRTETEDGDLIIDGYQIFGGDEETGLRYVFPSGGKELALVVEFFPSVDMVAQVQGTLKGRYGEPWEREMTNWWFDQLRPTMPPGVQELHVWGPNLREGDERFVRLWVFDDYLSVEYLDLQRLR